jgi:hypothetical protein
MGFDGRITGAAMVDKVLYLSSMSFIPGSIAA